MRFEDKRPPTKKRDLVNTFLATLSIFARNFFAQSSYQLLFCLCVYDLILMMRYEDTWKREREMRHEMNCFHLTLFFFFARHVWTTIVRLLYNRNLFEINKTAAAGSLWNAPPSVNIQVRLLCIKSPSKSIKRATRKSIFNSFVVLMWLQDFGAAQSCRDSFLLPKQRRLFFIPNILPSLDR